MLAGCGGETNPTVVTPTSIVLPPATSEADATTTTSVAEGPQPLVSGRLLEPGEYVTTDFEPTTVMYRIDRKHLLRPFQNLRVTGFENVANGSILNRDATPYRGVAVHGLFHGLTPEEILDELAEIERLKLGQTTATEVGGFPGQRIEAAMELRDWLWTRVQGGGGDLYRQWIVAPGPLDMIILETSAGTLLITITAPAEEWDEFLPVAEEILAGISFPDLD